MKKSVIEKEDEKSFKFKCGCGKVYLSNPALFTHTKLKHNSIKPPGSYFPNKKKLKEESSSFVCFLLKTLIIREILF